MVEINQFAKQFAQISQKLNKSAFETRFNAVQRGLIRQRQEEVAKVAQDNTERDVAALQKKRDDLFDKVGNLIGVQAEFKTNALRFLEIRDTVTSAVSAADEDEDDILTADEADALNAVVAGLKEEIHKLTFSTSIPGITDGNLANRLRGELEALEGLTAVAGTIDPADSGSPTNDNRAFLDTLDAIATRAGNYANSTTTLVGGINQVITDTNKRAYDTEADLAELTAGELAKKQQEILDIETQYNNLIRTISLAFEVNSGLGDALVQGTEFDTPKGSILNLFT